jgi:hypothetical protein
MTFEEAKREFEIRYHLFPSLPVTVGSGPTQFVQKYF